MPEDPLRLELDRRFAAAERLELERISALRREREIVTAAQEKAILKAEDSINERLALLNDRERAIEQSETRFLPREVFETTFAQWTDWRAGIDKALTRTSSERQGETALRARWLGLLVLVAGIAAAVSPHIH